MVTVVAVGVLHGTDTYDCPMLRNPCRLLRKVMWNGMTERLEYLYAKQVFNQLVNTGRSAPV
jgi:hypothetical protein